MSETLATSRMESPIGVLRIAVTENALVCVDLPRSAGLGFAGWLKRVLPEAQRVEWLPMLDKVEQEFEDYFAGRRRVFDIPLQRIGTEFQRRVWAALEAIPFGETRSYGEIAKQIGQPGASRAVGLANGANPLPIVIPCHRVIAAHGKLGGYGGGLDAKRRLLALEKSTASAVLL
ncbi:MAG: methylated-DNA--[protein]-cysteine S-methyltransferase [bacterium]|nr:methylated-DNA--[protein]-cysteine S-methyltransferase [bacterium]